MRFVIGLAVLVVTLGVLHCSPEDKPTGISEDTLKQLSLNGERLVDEAVRKALYGVKQMREVMVKNAEKHVNLMRSLRRSSDRKKGAAQLSQEVTGKLVEAEQRCKTSLQAEWEECRPCLEDACKTFYTSTCRRGFSTFHAKVERFFHRVSSGFGPRAQTTPPLEEEDEGALVNQTPGGPDPELARLDESFTRLLASVGALIRRSAGLVSRMRGRLDAALQRAFSAGGAGAGEGEGAEPTADPFSPSRDSAFLRGVGLEEVLDSFFDFGRSVVEEFGAVVTQVFDEQNDAEEEEKERERSLFPRFLRNRKLCRDLRRQTSECWQLQDQCEACQGALLTECPSVRELHVELDEASERLEACQEQYDEILAIARRHADDTVGWLSNMAGEFGWVGALADNAVAPETVFRVTGVAQGGDGDAVSGAEETTKVELSILNSPPLVLSVPAELELRDPAFIQYVAQEALGVFKHTVRNEDE